MPYLVIPKRFEPNRIYRSKTLSEQIRIGSFSLIVIMIFLICLIGVLFLTRFNDIATKGYILKKLEVERIHLTKVLERSDMNLAKIKTLEYVMQSPRIQSMAVLSEDRIVYVKEEGTVAAK